MNASDAEKLPPPPGIINSLKAGFDAVAARPSAILFPLALDLFIWLGPRLRMSALFDSIRGDVVEIWKSGGISPGNIESALKTYDLVVPNVNLFWLLRAIPIGVPNLPFAANAASPFGAPPDWQVSALNFLGWLVLLHLIGWMTGGLYFRAAAALVTPQPIGAFRALSQTILLSLAWTALLAMILIPLGAVLALITLLSPNLANLFLMAFFFAAMWAVVPLYFWSHGVFVAGQNVIVALWSSWRITRFMLPAGNLFILTVFVLSFGLNFLWSVPPQDSWMTLAGIFGHAFVSTALLTSSFIFYREANVWLEAALAKYKAGRLGSQA